MPINAIIYARSSPDCPVSAEDQIEHLNVVANEHGWTVKMTITDRPTPARKGKERRPGQDAVLDMIRRGEVQKVLLWSVDRVGRSLPELVGFLEACRVAGVSVYLHDRKIDTATANGMSLLDLASMMAFHVRQGRRDRILRGQAAAKNLNVKFGRPPISLARAEKAKELLANGTGLRSAARLAGISVGSASRLKGAMEQMSAGA